TPESGPRPRGSVGVGGDDLALRARAEGPDRGQADGILEEPDRAVAEDDVAAARVVAAEREHAAAVVGVEEAAVRDLGVGAHHDVAERQDRQSGRPVPAERRRPRALGSHGYYINI